MKGQMCVNPEWRRSSLIRFLPFRMKAWNVCVNKWHAHSIPVPWSLVAGTFIIRLPSSSPGLWYKGNFLGDYHLTSDRPFNVASCWCRELALKVNTYAIELWPLTCPFWVLLFVSGQVTFQPSHMTYRACEETSSGYRVHNKFCSNAGGGLSRSDSIWCCS